MHRISARQDAMLEELHQMTTRIEKLSQAEHDLISDVHPQVSEIKEHVENVKEVVSSEKSWPRAHFVASNAENLSTPTRTAVIRRLDGQVFAWLLCETLAEYDA
jgi:hypothetical protein